MLLEVDGLKKRFGKRVAVDGVSFSLDVGEILGFLGPNGAGKTTTMRILAGYLEPDEGACKVFNIDVLEERGRAQTRIGYLPEGNPLYGEMTPWAYLRFIAETRGMRKDEARTAVRRAAQDARLGDAIERPIETLSKGYRRRVGLAAALLPEPMLLILDEPTDGLDPNQREAVRDLIRRLGQERAIILSTHSLEEVAAVCTRAIVINEGRIVADGPPAKLAEGHADGLEGAFKALTGGQERVA
ncbi:MAG: ABC transporter ATP-binding protein [Hyphomonadaceae bacterium]|nr:ABC transporter ATP-binding protein [Hyphomonadaceae bacterium]